MNFKLPIPKIFTVALLLSLSFLLTACTLQDLPVVGEYLEGIELPWGKPVPTGPVTLTMWGLWESPEVMDGLIEQYQELHPNVTINYEDRSVLKPLSSYKERVFTRLSEDGGPDIVRVHNSWVSKITALLAPMPSSLMSSDVYTTTFYPAASQSAVVNGKIYAMPLFYDGLALVYNKDHFAEVGQQAPPTAWEEFRRLALELSVYSEDSLIRAGAAVGTADNIDHFADILGLMWAQANVSIPSEIDSARAQDALSFYVNFAKEDVVWNTSFKEASLAFANGEVSMIFVPSWQLLDIIESSPELNIGVATVPQVSEEAPASWGSFWMEAVSAKSPNASAAWDFLNFLTQKEQQLAFFNQSSSYRDFGSAYGRVDLADELALNDYLRPYVLGAPYATSAEIAGRSGNDRQVEALKAAVSAVLSGTDAATALTQAKATMSQ